jgi:hypothetical protein
MADLKSLAAGTGAGAGAAAAAMICSKKEVYDAAG